MNLAVAAIREPVCPSSRHASAIVLHGTALQDGETDALTSTIDLRSGFTITSRESGIAQSMNGFDGTEWGFANGILSRIDVPTIVPISRARAFVARLGWNDTRVHATRTTHVGQTVVRTYDLPETARVTVTSAGDAARPSRATLDAEWGPETTAFSDWRCVAGVAYPFMQKQTDDTGDTTVITVSRAESVQPNAHSFTPPKRAPHGHVIQGGAAPFRYVGKRDRHQIVDATVNGAHVQLVFDTGGANYFSPTAAKAMGLSVSGSTSVTGIGSGSASGGYARVPSMAIANAALDDEVVFVAPLPWPERPGEPVGSAGFEFLGEFRTTIDFPNQTIAFENFDDPAPAAEISLALKTDGHMPVVEASVNGIPGWFSVDTGDNAGITLFKTYTGRVGLHADSSLPGSVAGGVGGTVHLSQARVETFAIGGVTVSKPRVRLSEASAGAFASRVLAGNLGAGVFGCFKVIFDFEHRTLGLVSNASTGACLQELQ